MEHRYLTVERDNHIALVKLNRPDKLNALSLDLMEELEQVAIGFRRDAETRAVVLTGVGEHFTAGADLKDPRSQERRTEPLVLRRRSLRLGQRVIRSLYEMDQITIAAIHGAALGGGACIVTALDVRIGAEDCFVGYPEINLGMNLMWQALPLCVHLVGPARAKRLVILGQHEKAETLLEWGFLDEVVPQERLLERALEVASAYAAQPPVQSQMIKRSINHIASALDQAIMHMDFDQFQLAVSTEDAAEGVRAFFEKRKPEFQGD